MKRETSSNSRLSVILAHALELLWQEYEKGNLVINNVQVSEDDCARLDALAEMLESLG